MVPSSATRSPLFSFGAGTAAIFLAYLTVEGVVWAVRATSWTRARRVGTGIAIAVLGGGAAIEATVQTLLSHMCG